MLSAAVSSQKPSNDGAKPDITEDVHFKEHPQWATRHLKFAAGIAVVGLSITAIRSHHADWSAIRKLIEYPVSLTPAVLYLLATSKVSPTLEHEMHRKLDFLNKRQAGIPDNKKICSVSAATWLKHHIGGSIPDAAELKEADKFIKNGGNELFNTIEYLLINGFEIIKMKDSEMLHSKILDGFQPKVTDFSFPGIVADTPTDPPLNELNNSGEGLFCFLCSKPEQNSEKKSKKDDYAHCLVVVMTQENKFTIFDANCAKSFTNDSAQECLERLNILANQTNREFYFFFLARKKSSQEKNQLS